MKTCFKCEEEKPLNDFYRHPQMLDGHVNKCKECNKADVRRHRLLNIDIIRKYDRNRPNEDERRKQRYEYYHKNKEDPDFKKKIRESRIKYTNDNPIKRAAHIQWGNFIRNNEYLKRDKCSACGDNYSLEAHHEDYTKPLSVIWLCKNCHGARHKEINREIRNGVDWSSKGF